MAGLAAVLGILVGTCRAKAIRAEVGVGRSPHAWAALIGDWAGHEGLTEDQRSRVDVLMGKHRAAQVRLAAEGKILRRRVAELLASEHPDDDAVRVLKRDLQDWSVRSVDVALNLALEARSILTREQRAALTKRWGRR